MLGSFDNATASAKASSANGEPSGNRQRPPCRFDRLVPGNFTANHTACPVVARIAHAARSYSCKRPPRRSRRLTVIGCVPVQSPLPADHSAAPSPGCDEAAQPL